MARKTAKRQRRSRKHKKQRRNSRKLGGTPDESKSIPVNSKKYITEPPENSILNSFKSLFGLKQARVVPEDTPVATPVYMPTAVGSMVVPEADYCIEKQIYDYLQNMFVEYKNMLEDNQNNNNYNNIFLYFYNMIYRVESINDVKSLNEIQDFNRDENLLNFLISKLEVLQVNLKNYKYGKICDEISKKIDSFIISIRALRAYLLIDNPESITSVSFKYIRNVVSLDSLEISNWINFYPLSSSA